MLTFWVVYFLHRQHGGEEGANAEGKRPSSQGYDLGQRGPEQKQGRLLRQEEMADGLLLGGV